MKNLLILISSLILFMYCGGGENTTTIIDNTPTAPPGGAADTTPPTVAMVSPTDGATGVSTNAAISITFSEAINSGTITATFAGTVCSGTIQASKDNFVTCISFSSITPSNGDKTFTLVPSPNYSNLTTYKIRVTTGVFDMGANAMAAQYETTTGFTTSNMADSTPPTINSTAPVDGATGVSLGATVSVTFSEVMNPATISMQSTGGACSSNVQISSDNFTTCLGGTLGTGDNTTFTLNVTLSAVNTYKIKITTGVEDTAGNALATTYTLATGFTTAADGSAPTVQSITPADSATGITLGSNIVITFSEAMTVSTVVGAIFDGACSGSIHVSADNFSTCKGGYITTSDNISFTFVPVTGLGNNTVYKVKVTTDAKDLAGNFMASNFTLTNGFTTENDITSPFVTSTAPANNDTGVNLGSSIVVTFSEAVNIFNLIGFYTFNGTCTALIQISNNNFNTCLDGFPQFSTDKKVLTFIPNDGLENNKVYKIKVLKSVSDFANNQMVADYITANGFTTVNDVTAPTIASTNPVDTATSVALSTFPQVVFSEAVNAKSLVMQPADGACSGSIQLTLNNFASCISGYASVSLDKKTITISQLINFTLSSLLSNNTTYKIRVTTAVIDLGGNNLASTYTMATGFTTLNDTTAPTISSTNPADGAANTAFNIFPTVTFNENMDVTDFAMQPADGACSNSVQISSNNFTSCLGGTIYTSGATVTISALTNAFSNSITYKIKILNTVSDIAGNTLASTYTMSTGFTMVNDSTAPTVIGSNPADGSTNVALASYNSFQILMNESVKTSTIKMQITTGACTESIQLSSDNFTTCIGGSAYAFFGSNITVGVSGSNILKNTTYKFRLTTAIKDMAGNSLAAQYTSVTGFTTVNDTTPPTIISVLPADSATGLSVSSYVTITFSEPVSNGTMQFSDGACGSNIRVSSDNFTNCRGGQWLGSAINSNAYSFKIINGLNNNITHKVRITTGLTDLAGNALASQYTMATGFTTENDTTAPAIVYVNPVDNISGIALSTQVSLKFTEGMKTSTVTIQAANGACSSTVQISSDNFTNCLGGTLYLSQPNLVTVTLVSGLSNNSLHKIKVTTSAQDFVGNALAATFTQTNGFSTFNDTVAPSITSTIPVDGATNVATTAFIQITTSEPLLPSSVTMQSADGACTNSVQVSTDNFTTCKRGFVSASASIGTGFISVFLTGGLTNNTNYKVKVTTAVTDFVPLALPSIYTMASGFTTVP